MSPTPLVQTRSGSRIKICGICRAQDARAAADAGADAVGLNFVAGPRRITPQQARPVLDVLPPFVTPVALVNADGMNADAELRATLDVGRIRWLQWYGPWSKALIEPIRRGGFRIIRVVHVSIDRPTEVVAAAFHDALADALLFDAAAPDGRAGGTGTAFDWSLVSRARTASPASQSRPIIVAGGLTAENVADAIRAARPWAVDVSSGVESQPGVKDAGRMRAFVAAARSVERDATA
jgi:phosphoribosylanthranilate isomerase